MTAVLWFIAVFSLAGIAGVFFAKIPEVIGRPVKVSVRGVNESFWAYLRTKSKLLATKIWHFILEAKDLTPPVAAKLNAPVEMVKKVFRVRIRRSENDPDWLPEVSDTVGSDENIYLSAIKKDPNDKQAYEGLGRLYLQDKNYAEAEEVFRYLIKLDPDKDAYHSNLALILYSLQRYQEAVEEYNKALSINAKIGARWVNLSLCFIALDDLSRAIKALSNAVSLDPRNINSLSLLADIYMKAQNKMRAEEVLEQVLKLEPTSRQAREKLMRLKL
ncbi:MAG: tetratricopeptide repeat protein [Candidatus Doudnabacteria bacterium]|nr:tetratricopeptide repeat protein [Candidatus Doudnabacteria bacterium]